LLLFVEKELLIIVVLCHILQIESLSKLAASGAPVLLAGIDTPIDPSVVRAQCDLLAVQLQAAAKRLEDTSNVG